MQRVTNLSREGGIRVAITQAFSDQNKWVIKVMIFGTLLKSYRYVGFSYTWRQTGDRIKNEVQVIGMSKTNGKKQTATTVTKSATTGCFVASASAAYQYYASHDVARQNAVARFETRIAQSPTKPKTTGKKSRRSA